MGKGSEDLYIQAFSSDCIIHSEIFVYDFLKYSLDGTNLIGTYSTGSDSSYNYIYAIQNGTNMGITTFPSDLEFKFKFNKASGGALLWTIGADSNNGLLVGWDDTNNRMRIYERVNGTNTVKQSKENAFSTGVWTEATITIQSNTCSITIGSNTLSYAITTPINVLQLFTPNSNNTKITDIRIKRL